MMDVIRFAICGVFVAFSLTGAGPARAEELLAPNKPLLGASSGTPTETTAATTTPSPEPSAVPSQNPILPANPSPTGSLNLATPNQPQGAAGIDPKDIPEILLTEMKEIERNCTNNHFYSSFHDCKCITVKFLDARLKSDPDVPKERIFNDVAGQCPDEAGIAGYIYKSCAAYMDTVRKDYVSFCTCTANDVAKAYTRTPVMNLRYIEMLRRNAFTNCGIANNPDYVSPYAP
jgi:hypothetical protein